MSVKARTITLLKNHLLDLATQVVDEQLSIMVMTEIQKKASLRDSIENIQHLSNAIEMDSPLTFSAYIVWLRDVLAGYGFQKEVISDHLVLIANYVKRQFDSEVSALINDYILHAIKSLDEETSIKSSYLEHCGVYQDLASAYLESLLKA